MRLYCFSITVLWAVLGLAAAQDNTSRFSNVIVATNATVAGGLSVGGALTNSALTASRAVATGADKSLASSATTATELGFVSGVTSAIQTQIDGKQASLGYTPVNKAGDTMTGALVITNSAAGTSPLVINDATGASGARFQLNVGGVSKLSVTDAGVMTVGGLLKVLGNPPSGASGAGINFVNHGYMGMWNSILYLTADAFASGPGNVQFGNAAASPTSAYIQGQQGSGTDKVGGTLDLRGGPSTGTGGGGDVDVATSLSADATGSAANAHSIRYHANAKHIALTHNTATTIETFSLAANKILGGELVVTTYATNATPHLQARTTSLVFQAVAVSTTITGTIDVAKAGTLAASSGTMTETYTLLDNGNNTFSIQLAANSDLSTPTERCKVVVTALNGNAAVTITDP